MKLNTIQALAALKHQNSFRHTSVLSEIIKKAPRRKIFPPVFFVVKGAGRSPDLTFFLKIGRHVGDVGLDEFLDGHGVFPDLPLGMFAVPEFQKVQQI